MNEGLDYIMKRQGLGLVLLLCINCWYENFVVNQHKYITYRSKGEDLTYMHVITCTLVGSPVM